VNHRRTVGIDFLAEIGDVELNDVCLTAEVVVPDPIQDLGLAEHSAGVTHQIAQQLELGRGQLDLCAGAAYLIYLGVRKLLERGDSEEPISTPRTRNYLGGMIIQTLNPKIAIFFLAILPQFVRPSGDPMVVQILILGTIFTILAMLCNGGYVLLAGAVGGRLRRGARAKRRLALLSGCVYIGLSVSAALAGTALHAWASHQDLQTSPARY